MLYSGKIKKEKKKKKEKKERKENERKEEKELKKFWLRGLAPPISIIIITTNNWIMETWKQMTTVASAPWKSL